jgi:AcrR family transcriptional regulator
MARQGESQGDPTAGSIVTTALRLLRDEGPEALSFRRIAAALDISHTTVHRHCVSFGRLLDMCADQLAGQLPDLGTGLPWPEHMERRFTALYDLWVANPALLALRQGQPWWVPNMLTRFAEPAMAATLRTGMTPEQAVQAIRQLYLFTYGCSSTHAAYTAGQARSVLAALEPDEFPALASNVDVIVRGTPERDVFTQGLRALISAAQAAPAGQAAVRDN